MLFFEKRWSHGPMKWLGKLDELYLMNVCVKLVCPQEIVVNTSGSQFELLHYFLFFLFMISGVNHVSADAPGVRTRPSSVPDV